LTLSAIISDSGVTAPDYPTILSGLQDGYRSIFGSDVNLDADTQDEQQLAIFARAIYDSNQSVIAAYNSFSPNSAQGTGLSNLVKINGLKREVPSNSQAVVDIVGAVGTVITNGIIGDNLNLNTRWALPATVVIPSGGTISVTATCTELGSTAAALGTLTQILTPTRGWQSVTNASAATAGNPVEVDATLRQRQTASTALPSLTVLGGIYAAIANLSGVTRLQVYENDEDTADADGISPHSIAAVVLGGDATEILTSIASKKSPGTGTDGTTTGVIIDPHGVPETIRYYPLTVKPVDVGITIKALTGYTSTTGDLIKASVAQFLSTLDIGEDSYYLRLVAPANLEGEAAVAATGLSQQALAAFSSTFTVTIVTQAFHGNSKSAQNLTLAFNEAASGDVANIVLTVV
jgi:uncharacterized phage protein gp47/JayE